MRFRFKCLLAGMIIPMTVLSAGLPEPDSPVAWWKFDAIEQSAVREEISGRLSRLNGYQRLIDGAEGPGLLLDGYSTYVESPSLSAVGLAEGFTVEAWIAFQAYTWNWAAIVDQQREETAGFNLSVDANGFLRLQVVVDDELRTVRSSRRMELLKWSHVAGCFDPDEGLALFIDGEPAGSLQFPGDFRPAEDVPLWIGKSRKKLPPGSSSATHGTIPGGSARTLMSWSGSIPPGTNSFFGEGPVTFPSG